MWGTLMAIVVAATIAGSSADAFAMAGGGGHKRGGSNETTTYSAYEHGSWTYSSTPVASAPEPGTLVLLVSGAAGLALWARRRK